MLLQGFFFVFFNRCSVILRHSGVLVVSSKSEVCIARLSFIWVVMKIVLNLPNH